MEEKEGWRERQGRRVREHWEGKRVGERSMCREWKGRRGGRVKGR